jgi:hypothetical protein
MKKHLYPLLALLLSLHGTLLAQAPLQEQGKMSYLFFADDNGNYFYSMEPQSRDIRLGDEIDAVDALGHRVSFKVTKAKAEDNPDVTDVLPKGQYGMVDLHVEAGSLRDLGTDFYFVAKGAAYPGAAAPATAPAAPTQITAKVNGQPWSATVAYQGALFYARGLRMMDASGKPFLQLAFVAATSPDTRQITMQLRDFPARPGSVRAEQQEWLITGSATGDPNNSELSGYKPIPAYSRSSVSFQVTAWESLGPDRARLSGTFSAKLKGVLGAPDFTVTEGKIDGIEVKVYQTAE